MTTPEPTVASVRNVDAGHYRDMLLDAARVAIGRQKVGPSLIQRHVRVGFATAGRLLILLEDAGVIGPVAAAGTHDGAGAKQHSGTLCSPYSPRSHPMTLPEPTVTATRYTVSCLPLDHGSYRHFALTVKHVGDGEWTVTDGPYGLKADGTVDYERGWGDRFGLDTALKLAKEHAPKITVNGYTVADALARREARDA